MIDRIRHDIQQRLDQLLAEADKLRHALAALDPRDRPAPNPKPASAKPATGKPPAAASRASTAADGASSATRAAKTRTRPGATRAKVLAALSAGGTLTAADVATATGLARPTVSTTLSRLAKSGVIAKADRGYRLATATDLADVASGGE